MPASVCWTMITPLIHKVGKYWTKITGTLNLLFVYPPPTWSKVNNPDYGGGGVLLNFANMFSNICSSLETLCTGLGLRCEHHQVLYQQIWKGRNFFHLIKLREASKINKKKIRIHGTVPGKVDLDSLFPRPKSNFGTFGKTLTFEYLDFSPCIQFFWRLP